MSQISTEQWERRKWYLIRSLFNEVPLLSPIPETQELSLRPLSPTAATDSRPHSPLPELIIEKEPNRHDEPDEYYEVLERKVLKLYRKLFTNIRKSSQSSSPENDDIYSLTLDRESHTETVIFSEDIVQPPMSDNESTITSDECSNKNLSDFKNNEVTSFSSENTSDENVEQSYEERSHETNKKTNSCDPLTENSTTSESQPNETVLTQAIVHYAGSEKVDNHSDCESVGVTKASYSKTQNCGKMDAANVTTSVTDTTNSDEQVEEESETSNVSSKPCHSLELSDAGDISSSLEEPEIMRRRKTSTNSVMNSLNAFDIRRYFSTGFATDKRSEISSGREMEHEKISSPEMSVILGTTSASKRNKGECNRQNGNKRRRTLSETSSHQSILSPKQKKIENLATQTSLSTCDNEKIWQHVQKHFFEGNPHIFKLCSCNNHICC